MAVFEPALMPQSVKEELCRALLEEFQAISIRHRPVQQELIHGCLVGGDHTDQFRNPTASLNYDKLTYKCLGCGAQGGILWLITQVRGCPWNEAREWLQQATGTGSTVMPLQKLLEYYDALYADSKRRPAPIPSYATSTLDPWLKVVHPYLTTGSEDFNIKGRGIPEETVREMKVGWDSTDNTIVIPHFWKGKLVGWQKRRLSGSGPKYWSTEDMPKDQTLFDYDSARRSAVIVESPMSVLKHRHAIPMEGTFGASVTDRQISLMVRHHERLIVWMDNDEAGWKALEGTNNSPGIIERASPFCPVWIVQSPFAGDPGDLDTETVQAVLDLFTVPAVAWKRPKSLRCPLCQGMAHHGECVRAERAEDVA